jgi:hypothetical protein
MATYRQIVERVRATDNFVPKTCWIADVKAGYGLTRGIAANRSSTKVRAFPCPASKRSAIIKALQHFGMVSS